jgi:hypothetical protein
MNPFILGNNSGFMNQVARMGSSAIESFSLDGFPHLEGSGHSTQT